MVLFLRQLPKANKRLVSRNGLSDNDLSLIVLGLELIEQQHVVYVLSNDQDLLSFTTWVSKQTSARERWGNLEDLQALHGLTYLELVHRNCSISTSDMKDLIQYAMLAHYGRKELSGSQKGESIMRQLTEVYDSLSKSIEIKLSAREVQS